MTCKNMDKELFINNYRLARPSDEGFRFLVKKIFKSKISDSFYVKCLKKPLCIENECHTNCIKYSTRFGGERILGYYFITDIDDTTKCVAVKHSIYKNNIGDKIDITPFSDKREYNIFIPHENVNFKHIVVNNNEIQLLGFNIY